MSYKYLINPLKVQNLSILNIYIYIYKMFFYKIINFIIKEYLYPSNKFFYRIQQCLLNIIYYYQSLSFLYISRDQPPS
jgi:hypothetical protein